MSERMVVRNLSFEIALAAGSASSRPASAGNGHQKIQFVFDHGSRVTAGRRADADDCVAEGLDQNVLSCGPRSRRKT